MPALQRPISVPAMFTADDSTLWYTVIEIFANECDCCYDTHLQATNRTAAQARLRINKNKHKRDNGTDKNILITSRPLRTRLVRYIIIVIVIMVIIFYIYFPEWAFPFWRYRRKRSEFHRPDRFTLKDRESEYFHRFRFRESTGWVRNNIISCAVGNFTGRENSAGRRISEVIR